MMIAMSDKQGKKPEDRLKRLSLKPLSVNEALKGAMEVKPPSNKPKARKATKKKRTKRRKK